ncbi:carotenoid oxygenase family protein [Nocardia wallacei]|uniref:carotenoid oxygenase family protein n=1 Tax=Nocardia wallacei TaxID=480035 RepID=UPI003CC7EEDA
MSRLFDHADTHSGALEPRLRTHRQLPGVRARPHDRHGQPRHPDAPQFPDSRLVQYRITKADTERELSNEQENPPIRLASIHPRPPLHQPRRSGRPRRTVQHPHQNRPPHRHHHGCDPADSSVGEPLFVPRTPDAAEDDGWLLALNHDLTENRSQLLVFDARDLEAGPLATAWLEHHIRWGIPRHLHPPPRPPRHINPQSSSHRPNAVNCRMPRRSTTVQLDNINGRWNRCLTRVA